MSANRYGIRQIRLDEVKASTFQDFMCTTKDLEFMPFDI